jgi:hypothetical protein
MIKIPKKGIGALTGETYRIMYLNLIYAMTNKTRSHERGNEVGLCGL